MGRFGWTAIMAGAVLAVAGLALAPPLAVASVWDSDSGLRPTDTAMIARFTEKRPLFDTLAGMLQVDTRLKHVGADWTDPTDLAEAGISPARLADYRRLMTAVGVQTLSHYPHSMEFLAFASGLSLSGTSKSYIYGDPGNDSEEVEGDLDAAAGDRRHVMFDRVIDGRWHLQLDLR